MMAAPNLLELHNISKTFGALTALRNLSFHIGQGEVVGLLGDNGAGKSTTVNLISGIHRPSSGYLSVDGEKVVFTCRSDSASAGIETIYQNTALVDSLSITRNIFMGRERTNALGFLKQAEMRDIAMEVLEKAVHISGIDSPDKLVGDLSGGQKQAVAIARAVFFKRRILLSRRADFGIVRPRDRGAAQSGTEAEERERFERAGDAQSLSRFPGLRSVRDHEPRRQGVRRGQVSHHDRRAHRNTSC